HAYRRERADAATHVGAVEVGQAEVQEDQVERGLGRRDDRLLTVGRGPDLVAVGLEAGPQRAPDLGLVVDDEQAGHAPRSGRPRARPTTPPPRATPPARWPPDRPPRSARDRRPRGSSPPAPAARTRPTRRRSARPR